MADSMRKLDENLARCAKGDPDAIVAFGVQMATEARRQALEEVFRSVRRSKKIADEFSEPGHSQWRKEKAKGEAFGEVLNTITRLLDAAPSA